LLKGYVCLVRGCQLDAAESLEWISGYGFAAVAVVPSRPLAAVAYAKPANAFQRAACPI
jgi:hypothetical protein